MRRNFDDVELVDFGEFERLGRGRAGHAGQLAIKAEVILEGDRGQRHVFRLDLDMLLGFERLMQPFRIAAPRHHAAGEFVDDDDLALAHDVILVALEQLVRAQGLIDVVDDGDVLRLVERALGEDAGLAEQFLHMFVAGVGQADRALLLVEVVIFLDELREELVDGVVEIGFIVDRAGNDQRRARLVDEDRIHFVDDRERMSALRHLRQLVFHIVAQIVEAELVIGAVGDVAGVGGGAILVRNVVNDDADAHAEEVIDLPHPFGVALGEIVVDGDDMHAFSRQRVEIDRERRDQRLAFAGAHLGDAALVQHHAADQLHVEMALAERAPRRLAHRCEGGHEQIVKRPAGGELLAELLRAGAQRLVRERGDLGLQRVDRPDFRLIGLQPAFVCGAENFLGEGAEHSWNLSDWTGALA